MGLKYGNKNNPAAPEPPRESSPDIRQGSFGANYKFINPLLECDIIENTSNKKINSIKSLVKTFIEEGKSSLDFISVYFRDLNNGPWFGINEKEEFVPGSLLKVPLMMSVFKVAKSNPVISKKEIFYENINQELLPQYFKPEKEIKPGKIYVVEDLIEAMIKYSDNNAAFLLTQILTQKQFEESYTDLGIEMPSDYKSAMPVKTYASFFRILFNATYLNKEFSEKVLSILSQTTFKEGLRAGVPAGVTVADKFGEREIGENNQKQLHDCGIIYYPEKPYILCIMTRGNNFEKLAAVIKNISSLVYQEIDKK